MSVEVEQKTLFADLVPDGEAIQVRLDVEAGDLPPDDELYGSYDSSFRASIGQHGIQIPILIRDSGTTAYRYKVIDGGRRVKAGREIGYDTVEAIYYGEMDDATSDAFALMVHAQRNDNLATDFVRIESLLQRGATEAQIAAETGLSRQTIAKRMRVRGLITELRAGFIHGRLSSAVAHACTKLSSTQQETVAEQLRAGAKVHMKDVDALRRAQVQAATANLSFLDILDAPGPDEVFVGHVSLSDIRESLTKALLGLGLTVAGEGDTALRVQLPGHSDGNSFLVNITTV